MTLDAIVEALRHTKDFISNEATELNIKKEQLHPIFNGLAYLALRYVGEGVGRIYGWIDEHKKEIALLGVVATETLAEVVDFRYDQLHDKFYYFDEIRFLINNFTALSLYALDKSYEFMGNLKRS